MSVKIRISYDHKPEAERVLKALSPVIRGAKIRRSDSGKYKKIVHRSLPGTFGIAKANVALLKRALQNVRNGSSH